MALPSRAAAFRVLGELENRYPTFRLSAKRNRDIADRPNGCLRKTAPDRPGEYLLMDTTRLDVFALDPITLRWVRRTDSRHGLVYPLRRRYPADASLHEVGGCSGGVVPGISTTAGRKRLASASGLARARYPTVGADRRRAVEGPSFAVAGPAIVPETIVIDHGKIYLSEHLTSVCRRMGISIQPARLRTGRDKGAGGALFRTLREDLFQILPGYKGPDVHSAGWTRNQKPSCTSTNWRRSSGVGGDGVSPPTARQPGRPTYCRGYGCHRPRCSNMASPAPATSRFPRDPGLAEFLQDRLPQDPALWVDFGGRRYNGPALNPIAT